MSSPNRRDLLSSIPLGAVVLSAPAFADDHGHDLRSRIARLRARWRADEERFSLHLAQHLGEAPEIDERLAALRGGLVAFAVFKETEKLPLEEQVHPAVQRLIRQLARAVGAAVKAAGEAAGGWADGWGVEADPDEEHLRRALSTLRADLAQAALPHAEATWVEGLLADLLDAPTPGWLRRRARVGARQARKAGNLAAQIAADPGRTGLLESDDPILQARVEAALAARALAPQPDDTGVDEEGGSLGEDLTGMEVLGIVILGLIWVGGLLVSTIGLCAILCGGPQVGAPLLLLGVGAMVLARRAIRNVRGLTESEPELDPTDPTQALAANDDLLVVFRGRVLANGDWVHTDAEVNPRNRYMVYAWGLMVGGGGLGAADPDGDGSAAGPAAVLPGAPRLGLIGRVGATPFFIGSAAALPEGIAGHLRLAVNTEPGQDGLQGAFQVVVARDWRVP